MWPRSSRLVGNKGLPADVMADFILSALMTTGTTPSAALREGETPVGQGRPSAKQATQIPVAELQATNASDQCGKKQTIADVNQTAIEIASMSQRWGHPHL